MTFRTYLRLFQPIPALLMTAVMANGAAVFGHFLFGASHAEGYLLALLIALPLLLGMDLAAAGHTALHRPFSLLLPDVLAHVQRATLWAALACNLAITLLVVWFFPAVPTAAVFGLVAPLLIFPCLNRRRLIARPGLFNLSVNFGGLQLPLLLVVGWFVFMKLTAHRLVPAMQAAPWLFFVGGLATGAWLLRRAFTRESLLERAETPFISPNVAWIVLFNRKVMTRQQEEVRQHVVRFGAGGAQQQLAARLGRDWTVRTVGPRTRDWLRVHWHATYGVFRNGSFLRAQGLIFLTLLVSTFIVPLLGFFFVLLENRSFRLADYLASLAAIASFDIGRSSSAAQAGTAFMGVLLAVTFMFVLTLAGQLRPHLPYPVSRERLAQAGFALALLQLGASLLVPTTALGIATVIGQMFSGQPAAEFGVLPLLRFDFVSVPLLLLAAAAGRLAHMAVRIATLAVLGTLACGLAVSGSMWGQWIDSPPGFAALIFLSLGSALLLRWQIRRHFRTCDLLAEAAEARPFVFAATATFSRTSVPAAA
jgi:hypothetical protein